MKLEMLQQLSCLTPTPSCRFHVVWQSCEIRSCQTFDHVDEYGVYLNGINAIHGLGTVWRLQLGSTKPDGSFSLQGGQHGPYADAKTPTSTCCPLPTRWIPEVFSVSTWTRSTSTSTSTSSSHPKTGQADLQPYMHTFTRCISLASAACRTCSKCIFLG